MKPTFLRLCAAATMAALLAAPASAHRAWMLPSSFTLSGENQWVTVDGAISNNLFHPNHHPMSLESVTVTAPDGSAAALQNAATGKYRAVFDVSLDRPGTYRISSGSAGFMASWEEDGERKRLRGTAEGLKTEGIFDKPGVQITRSVRRIETYVTLGSPDEAVFQATSEGLELVPVTHPNDVFAGEEVQFRFLLDGAPASGVEVEIVRGHDRYRDEDGILTLTTGPEGEVSFVPEVAGPYWLSAEQAGEGSFEGRAIRLMNTYVVTFEALP